MYSCMQLRKGDNMVYSLNRFEKFETKIFKPSVIIVHDRPQSERRTLRFVLWVQNISSGGTKIPFSGYVLLNAHNVFNPES